MLKRVLIVFTAIGLWQMTFFLQRFELNERYRIDGTIGMQDRAYHAYLYFFHYLGWFPAAVPHKDPTDFSKEGALKFAKENHENLVMDAGYTSGKLGDYGKIFLYYPEVLFRSFNESSIRISITFFQVAILTALFFAFWSLGFRVLAIALVLFLGSNPCQLIHLYLNPNVYPFTILTTVALLALHLRLLWRAPRFSWGVFLLPIISGIVLAAMKQVRPEPFVAIVGVAFAYIVTGSYRFWQRGALVAALFLSLVTSKALFEKYFEVKANTTAQAIQELGGHPYPGFRSKYHVFWHPFFVGLGDFDKKHGITPSDFSAYEYAVPILQATKYPNISYQKGSYFLDQHYDKAEKYRMSPEDLPEYEPILRKRFIEMVTEDPVWYLQILGNRMLRIVKEATPASIAIGKYYLRVPYSGILFLGILVLALYMRSVFALKVIGFTLPLSFVALFVNSSNGYTFYTIHSVVAFAFLLEWISERVRFRAFQRQYNIESP